jgi:membrane protein
MQPQPANTSPEPGDRTASQRDPMGIGRRLLDSFRRDDLGGLAAEIAYRFLFAVFPFGLFVAALSAFVAPILGLGNPAGKVISGLGDNLPTSIASSMQPELEHLMSTARPDLVSVGALGALLAAIGGTNALVKAMHRAYDVPEGRPLVLRYAISVLLTLVASIGVLASFVTIVGGTTITGWIARTTGLGDDAPVVLDILRWPLVFVGLTIAVAILYRYAPNVVVPWRWILAGSAVFTVGWLLVTVALGFYVDHFADYGATYGSLGGVIVLMIWFYVSAVLLLGGAELTAALAWERTPGEIRRRREELQAAATLDRATDGAKEAAAGSVGAATVSKLARPGAGPD